jgi:hypothetical protein
VELDNEVTLHEDLRQDKHVLFELQRVAFIVTAIQTNLTVIIEINQQDASMQGY